MSRKKRLLVVNLRQQSFFLYEMRTQLTHIRRKKKANKKSLINDKLQNKLTFYLHLLRSCSIFHCGLKYVSIDFHSHSFRSPIALRFGSSPNRNRLNKKRFKESAFKLQFLSALELVSLSQKPFVSRRHKGIMA